MHDESVRLSSNADVAPLAERGPLRVFTVIEGGRPQRRRSPRRRTVCAVAQERRCTDRRLAKPGVDGLLRTVIADDYKLR